MASLPVRTDTLVLDLGSHTVKCGLAGAALGPADTLESAGAHNDAPTRPPFCVPSLAGRERFSRGLFGATSDRGCGVYVGFDASPDHLGTRKGLLKLSYPIQNGMLRDAEAGEYLLKQAVNTALIPGYRALKTQQQQRRGHANTGDRGARALAGLLERQQGEAEEQERQERLLHFLDRIGDGDDEVSSRTRSAVRQLFGSYYAVSGGGGVGSASSLGGREVEGEGDLSACTQLLRASRSQYHAALLEAPYASRPQRARLAELLFESNYGERSGRDSRGGGTTIGALFCGVTPLLALYGTGKTSGVVLDVGHQCVSTACAVNGHALTPAMQRSDGVCGGDAVTEHLRQLLHTYRATTSGGGHSEHTSSTTTASCYGGTFPFGSGSNTEKQLLTLAKEQCCSVLPWSAVARSSGAAAAATTTTNTTWQTDETKRRTEKLYPSSGIAQAYQRRREALASLDLAVEEEEQRWRLVVPHLRSCSDAENLSLSLPDGGVVAISPEAALCAAEVHFRPIVAGHSADACGVVDLLTHTVQHSSLQDHLALRPILLSNVVLTGGATCTKGFGQRLLAEMQARTPAGVAIRVVEPQERACGAWLGAAFLSQLSTFPSMCTSRAAYMEEGEAAIHARLFA